MSAALAKRMEALGAVADEPMSAHTYVRIGGPADWYLEAAAGAALAEAIAVAREEGLPVCPLGRGSNLLVGDAGIRGLVVRPPSGEGEPRIIGDAVALEADAGAPIFVLARTLAARGIRGLEWAEGIPGTLGGAAVTNAGAYGGCFADIADSVDAISPEGRLERLAAADLALAYRDSALRSGGLAGWIVARIRLSLRLGDADEALACIREAQRHRGETKPRGASLGSTFRNPAADPEAGADQRAWELLDRAGLRGHRIGGARVSDKHPNYFINTGGASARDYAALIRFAQERVREACEVALEPEITFAGEGFE